MLKNKRKGLTLIEVILAIAILSILLVTYITIFGQSSLIVSKGKSVTNDTFSYQEEMENAMVDGKQSFIKSNLPGGNSIEIFTKYEDYKTNIDTKKIKIEIKGSRQYIAYVTNYEIKEPRSPKVNPFEVGVYNGFKKAFPWYQDNIAIVSKYTLLDDPIVFENRIRWYESNENILNPVFSSDYNIIYEEIQKEPRAEGYTNKLVKNKIKPETFYYFEARPYTLAGRLEHFKNEDRILILNRAGSQEWQDFMEEVYFDKLNNTNIVKKFKMEETYLDVMQNPKRPTLNLDWSKSENPQGALVGIKIPDKYSDNEFQTNIKFQIDEETLTNAGASPSIGVGLVDNNNTGFMVDFNPGENLIYVNEIEKGIYKNQLKKINILNDEEFVGLIVDGLFDWSKEYGFRIEYYEENKIQIKLEDNELTSDFMEIQLNNTIDPKYVGLKSYSNIDYMPNLKYEIFNKYDRNYSSHFYNIEFNNVMEDDGD